jgi:glycosyltransferase involved in cell wall biosynthesis
MRITFLVPHIRISGGIKIICEYARRLASRDHRVTLIIRQKNLPLLRNIAHWLVDTIGWIDLKGVNVRFAPSFNNSFIPDADAIFATSWKTAAELNELTSAKGRKFYLVQGLENMFNPDDASPAEQTYRLPFTKIAVSNWLKDELKNRFNQDSELVPDAIDPAEFFPEDKSYGSKRLGMLYHTAEYKGFADGLKAINIVRQSIPDVKLTLFGARHRRPADIGFGFEYYQNADAPALRRVYSACDVFVCPSWYEGFGLPGLEAMACKTALATTDNGGCGDYAVHNETALLSPPKSPAELADNIIKLLNDQALLRRISEGGYKDSQRFNWDSSVSKMERIICQA